MQAAKLGVLAMGCLRRHCEEFFRPRKLHPLTQVELRIKRQACCRVRGSVCLLGDRKFARMETLKALRCPVRYRHRNTVLVRCDVTDESGPRLRPGSGDRGFREPTSNDVA